MICLHTLHWKYPLQRSFQGAENVCLGSGEGKATGIDIGVFSTKELTTIPIGCETVK